MADEMLGLLTWVNILMGVGIMLTVFVVLKSIHVIGPTQVGLVTKRFSWVELHTDSSVALNGEAGYQADLLMPGWRFKFWVLFRVDKYPWVQVPAGEIGVVIAQVGAPLPIGAKSGVYRKEFGNYTDVRFFVQNGGQKGVQRSVLAPGTSVPIHPAAFLVITKRQVYGLPVDTELQRQAGKSGLSAQTFGLSPQQLDLVRIGPETDNNGNTTDMIGIVTVLEGDPLSPGDIACRLGGFGDVEAMERDDRPDAEIVEALLGSQNQKHNNYQDIQAFLDNGGKIGLQHDPLLYGAYSLNPFLVRVERVPMLVVNQGEVAVIKAYVGLVTQDVSGDEFKHGALVRPGRRGIWREPLRTGKYAINPHCYQWQMVPTAILTLNWADAVSTAHNLDSHLSQIVAKSREGFVFNIDLQVQIHVSDKDAPKVISMVGTMHNLVNEVLQAAVGNHFRDKLQSMPAVDFIETRQRVQQEAELHIKDKIDDYRVETLGVYIQDVMLPDHLVAVLKEREIANQEIQTFQKQREAQHERVAMEQAKGTAEMQAQLAKSKVGVDIQTNNADARKKEAEGEAFFISETGKAKAAEVEAVGMAKAKGFEAQRNAIGAQATAIVNAINAIADGKVNIMPQVLVAGGSNAGGVLEGLGAVLLRNLQTAETTADEKPMAVAAGERNGVGVSQPQTSAKS